MLFKFSGIKPKIARSQSVIFEKIHSKPTTANLKIVLWFQYLSPSPPRGGEGQLLSKYQLDWFKIVNFFIIECPEIRAAPCMYPKNCSC